jgi:hypothetical protein
MPRRHVDALLLLSRDVRESSVSAKLQEMADEIQLMVSVADKTGLAGDLGTNGIPFLPSVLLSKPRRVA